MIRKCEFCNKEFKTYPSKIKIGRGKYCSKECCLFITKKFIQGDKAHRFTKGEKPHNFKGFRYSRSRPGSGRYILIFKPNHPKHDSSGYVRLHRLVMEQHIGRLLEDDEIVHHIDGNTEHNTIDNLELMQKKEHDRMNTPLNIHRRWIEH